MGDVFIKVAARFALARARAPLMTIFGDLQYGALRSQGAEHIVLHSRQEFRGNKDNVLVSIDLTNAFNVVHRDRVVEAVYRYSLEDLYNIVTFLYAAPSQLCTAALQDFFSTQGVRQGDSLGSILFALAIHHDLVTIRAAHPVVLIRAHLDDIQLFGPPRLVRACAGSFASASGR
jgi:hypothetical protein